jgi:hypothetical protein
MFVLMNAAPARTEVELHMMESLVDGAYALAMAFGDAAARASDFEQRAKLQDAFLRSFQAVRLGVRLSIVLRGERAPANDDRARPAPQPDTASEAERTERESDAVVADRDHDRERDRDFEPVSLARFLQSVRGVTADARRLPAQADPAVLPTVEGLLSEIEAEAVIPTRAGVATLARPSPTRARFLGSAALVTSPTPAHPRESGDPGFFR